MSIRLPSLFVLSVLSAVPLTPVLAAEPVNQVSKCDLLAALYRDGLGVPQDQAEADRLERLALQVGNGEK